MLGCALVFLGAESLRAKLCAKLCAKKDFSHWIFGISFYRISMAWLTVRCPPPSAGTVATGLSYDCGSAASGAEMAAGVHCAHFTLRKAGSGLPYVGVVGAGFDAARDQWAQDSAEGWMLGTSDGRLRHDRKTGDWAGKAAAAQLKEGDVVVRSHHPAARCALPVAGG